MPSRRRKGRVRKLAKGERGFTLVEIIVAAMLLLFAMAGIVPFFLAGLSQASSVRHKSIATNIARERMEQIRQLDYREITEDSAEGVTLTERFGTTTVERDIPFDISYAVEGATYEEGLVKKVTVNVTWDDPPAVSAAAITTLIHQQYLGPRGALLEVTPTSPDPLGSPFPVIASTTKVRYHVAQADWELVYDNLDQAGMTPRDVYMRLMFYDQDGQSISVGDPDNDYRIDNSYLRYSTDADGKVNDVWFEYNFDAWSIPDGYWELRAVAYNQWDQPGNVWRLIVRIEKGAPEAPALFAATPQADNQTVLLTWMGGPELDRAYYVLERYVWLEGAWSGWTPVAGDIDPKASSYTDSGTIGVEDPWGTSETPNRYLYRLWAVDKCSPGKVGGASQVETEIPSPTTTTTLVTSTTSTSSTSTTSTTLASSYSVMIRNASGSHYSVTVKNMAGATVFSGNIKKGDTATLTNLASGYHMITATSPGESPITGAFSLPEQNEQIVFTIYDL